MTKTGPAKQYEKVMFLQLTGEQKEYLRTQAGKYCADNMSEYLRKLIVEDKEKENARA